MKHDLNLWVEFSVDVYSTFLLIRDQHDLRFCVEFSVNVVNLF